MRGVIHIFGLGIIFSFLLATNAFSQDPNFEPFKDTVPKGVSVSPPTVRFNLKSGTSQSKNIKITNDTDFPKTFQIKAQDYRAEDINREAQTSIVPEDYKYGLKKWLYVTPSLVTIQPGQKANINVLLDVPAGDEFAHAAWSLIIIDEVKDRQELNVPTAGNNGMGLGIVPSMGFGIFVYQNPPNVKNNAVELTGYTIDAAKKKITMKASNKGDGIGFCTYYVELLNMATGETFKMPFQTATLLPGSTRELVIELPALSSGSYNALGVLDFGSKEYVETAELDFAIP
jgi:P pilus assembly chaperone PapD